ncbi:MAG: acyl-CoA synthetase FdrA [Anaerolineales bacterium]|nr:MAG: acyl-CoA synthetase FdrA [Anaerolineales bacterium]
MASGFAIRKNEYYDSVFLMGINKRLGEAAGVEQTAVLMGTEANKRLLTELGIAGPAIATARPNDLIIAVIAESDRTVQEVINSLDVILKTMVAGRQTSGVRTLDAALERTPTANLAVYSIPGEYVTDEALKALEAGLNLFIFSSNVPLSKELELKQFGRAKNLLVMGPDCGTSIIDGVGIGFANVVRRGTVGVVGPSGTGLQEFTTRVHNAGGGISHAIGTGSNDLSDEIGGITTLMALQMLEADTRTEVLAIIAKPPGTRTLASLLEQAQKFRKPLIACFLGSEKGAPVDGDPIQWARTIDDAAELALQAAGVAPSGLKDGDKQETQEQLAAVRERGSDEARYLRGLFAGGTFCYQSQQILRDEGIPVYSNGPIDKKFKLADPYISHEHTLIDMGDEFFTLGKPHPMIDSTERAKRILVEAADPSVAILLLDFIFGYNASKDPVGDLLDALQQAQAIRRRAGSKLTIVASVCGTKDDPQDLDLQVKMLEENGVLVFHSNARAVLYCKKLIMEQLL